MSCCDWYERNERRKKSPRLFGMEIDVKGKKEILFIQLSFFLTCYLYNIDLN